MKKLYSLPAIILFAVFINAQPGAPDVVDKSATVSPATAKKSGLDIPPEKAKPMNVPKIATPITIDGRPDEEAWQQASVFKDFYQTNPGNNIAPSKPTEVLMMYDEKHLYVAFKCWDEKMADHVSSGQPEASPGLMQIAINK